MNFVAVKKIYVSKSVEEVNKLLAEGWILLDILYNESKEAEFLLGEVAEWFRRHLQS